MNKLAQSIVDDAKKIINTVDLSEIAGKTVMVTGASGLIGTYFLACLQYFSGVSKKKFEVIAVIHSELPDFLREILNFDGVRIIKGDLENYDFCKSLPEVDYIIHAAGYGQPGRFMENPIKTLQINTTSTFSLLEKLKKCGKFLFVSTSEVYSGLTTPPYKETEIGITNTTHARSCYIEAKRCGEAICNAYREKGVNAKSARLSLAYGPGTRSGDKRVINSFIQKGINGQIELLDQGHAKRTYCYISDAIECMWNILLFGEEAIYNVGGKSRVSIAELAKKIGMYLEVPVIFPKMSQEIVGAPEDVYLDMSKSKNEFNKNDYISLDEGLAKTIEWQKLLYNKNI